MVMASCDLLPGNGQSQQLAHSTAASNYAPDFANYEPSGAWRMSFDGGDRRGCAPDDVRVVWLIVWILLGLAGVVAPAFAPRSTRPRMAANRWHAARATNAGQGRFPRP